MDLFLDYQLRPIAVVFAIAAILYTTLRIRRRNVASEPPQPSRALPIIGHLHLLTDRTSLGQTLASMADKVGPVFMLRLGMRRTLVISSCKAARECFITNDIALSSRPIGAAGKYLGYNYAMFGFAPYGPYWRSVRKIATVELLSNARIELFKRARTIEINFCMKELYELSQHGSSPVMVDMKQRLGDLAYNIILNLVAGKRYFGSGGGSDEAWRFRKAVSEFFRLLGVFVPADVFPFLRGVVDLGGFEGEMKAAAREMDAVMEKLLEEHRREMAEVERDFMDVLLSFVGSSELFSEVERDKFIKATSLTLIIGGTDTTSGSMTCTLAALLDNPCVLNKVQAELDVVVGRDRVVDESDIKNLPYLQAAVKESFRLYPRSKILLPREFTADCIISGYHIPAGTQLMVNAWKLHRDPSVWGENACVFLPERFMSPSRHEGVELRGQHLELIPFGSGRRVCPGISFALSVLHLTLARLIQGFEMETAADLKRNDIGITKVGTPPMEVTLRPRLHERLYNSSEV